jgi:hypothetical protein
LTHVTSLAIASQRLPRVLRSTDFSNWLNGPSTCRIRMRVACLAFGILQGPALN